MLPLSKTDREALSEIYYTSEALPCQDLKGRFFMNLKEFTFEALFESTDFERYDTLEIKKVNRELYQVLEKELKDSELLFKIEPYIGACAAESYDGGFIHGFCFAVKIIKFLLKI